MAKGEEKGKSGEGAPPSEVAQAPAKIEDAKVIEHGNVYEALAAFQAHNPELVRSKHVEITMKSGEKYEFDYAPLDKMLNVIRPLTGRHGLAVVHEEGKKEGTIVAALYHSSYENVDGKEKNVIRSMPITVRRSGDMKDIGSDSTYARRTTLAEVLGIASEEDNDAKFDEARRDQAENAIFVRVQKAINEAKTTEQLDSNEKVLQQNLADIKNNKVPALGLAEPQLTTLVKLVASRRAEIAKPGTGAPGDNKDAGGTAEVKQGEEETGEKKVPLL